MFCTASSDKTVKIWKNLKWNEINFFKEHEDEVYVAQFSKDDKFIYSGGLDKKIIKWNIETLEILFYIQLNNSLISLALNSDSTLLISGDYIGILQFWEEETQK